MYISVIFFSSMKIDFQVMLYMFISREWNSRTCCFQESTKDTQSTSFLIHDLSSGLLQD